ncbi:hypothetical protein TNCV_3287711 [Trichonephila clavipes]|nr:hypothetical protein TNCV_3287711 [Trichonephila clavipes]
MYGSQETNCRPFVPTKLRYRTEESFPRSLEPFEPTTHSSSHSKKYDETRLLDHARFNDGTKNANHNDEIINGESIPIYSFILLKTFTYDGLSR